MQDPLSFHLAVTEANVGNLEKFVRDVQTAVDQMKADPSLNKKGDSAIYGFNGTLNDKKIIGKFLYKFLDAIYTSTSEKPKDYKIYKKKKEIEDAKKH